VGKSTGEEKRSACMEGHHQDNRYYQRTGGNESILGRETRSAVAWGGFRDERSERVVPRVTGKLSGVIEGRAKGLLTTKVQLRSGSTHSETAASPSE